MYDRRVPQSGPGVPGSAANAVPLAAPRPGYPAPIASLNVSSLSSPHGQPPDPPQMGQVPQGLRTTHPKANTGAPRVPPPVYQTAAQRPSVPNAPHPLQPPETPILPVFARPSKSPPSQVKFSEAIMRGNSEDNLLPKRGERGDDFWRRFSMVAKEEKKPSSWLVKTESGISRWSRWVWLVGVLLVIGAGIGIGLWYYISHTTPSHQQPTAVGGSADETAGPVSPTAKVPGASVSPLVTPTYTLAHRAVPDPSPTMYPFVHVPHQDALQPVSRHNTKHRRRGF